MIAKGMRELTSSLNALGKHITIETAGTIAPEGIKCDLASLSPKLSDSTPRKGDISDAWIERHESTRLNFDVLNEWTKNYNYQLKFVISERGEEIKEIQNVISKIGELFDPRKVLLMPEGIDIETILGRYDLLIDLCLENEHECVTDCILTFLEIRGT